MHCYMETNDRANPGMLVIGSCHPNHLGHATILARPLMALAASTCYSQEAQDLSQQILAADLNGVQHGARLNNMWIYSLLKCLI